MNGSNESPLFKISLLKRGLGSNFKFNYPLKIVIRKSCRTRTIYTSAVKNKWAKSDYIFGK